MKTENKILSQKGVGWVRIHTVVLASKDLWSLWNSLEYCEVCQFMWLYVYVWVCICNFYCRKRHEILKVIHNLQEEIITYINGTWEYCFQIFLHTFIVLHEQFINICKNSNKYNTFVVFHALPFSSSQLPAELKKNTDPAQYHTICSKA